MFRMFLEYLYNGHLETSEISTEQIADMMTLADRYEVTGKTVQFWPILYNEINRDRSGNYITIETHLDF